MKETKHIYYFDYIRIFAFIAVIFMHVASGPLSEKINLNWHLISISTSLAFTAVPLFFMMSGYLLLSSKKTNDTETLFKHKLPRLIFPLIFWSTIAIVWILYMQNSLTLKLFIAYFLKIGNGPVQVHMWYMYTLISLYLISPLLNAGINNVDKKYHKVLFTIIIIILIQYILTTILKDPLKTIVDIKVFNNLNIFGGNICTFFLGYYLGTSDKKISNKLLISLFIIMFIIISCGTSIVSVKSGNYNTVFQSQTGGFEIIFASIIFLLAKQNLNKRPKHLNELINSIVKLSLPIYLFHNILLSILIFSGVNISSFIDVILVTILVSVISFIICKILSLIKYTCYISTGIEYNKR